MTTYALVHGAWHGAWCWERLAAELWRRGHRAVAVDLPCGDSAAGCARYAEIVTTALADADENVVVVGHSLGGLTIPLVAAARPVQRLIFLSALLPQPGRSLDDQVAEDPSMICPGVGHGQYVHPDGSTSWDPERAASVLYPDCEPDLAHWAARHLRRQNWRATQEISPLAEWPTVECQYILCADDLVVNTAWSRRAARGLLGRTVTELPGGHCPFLSRPAALADALGA
jgi:pimeloyl-ACP methyl ester carboxylesterase